MDSEFIKETYKLFAERLKFLRLEKKRTQSEAGDLLGLSQSAYSKYELGEQKVTLHLMKKIAQCYNVSLDYLGGLTEERNYSPQKSITESEKEYLQNFKLLDRIDRAEIRGEIKGMLKQEKYQDKDRTAPEGNVS